jgi:hypothetical protein
MEAVQPTIHLTLTIIVSMKCYINTLVIDSQKHPHRQRRRCSTRNPSHEECKYNGIKKKRWRKAKGWKHQKRATISPTG